MNRKSFFNIVPLAFLVSACLDFSPYDGSQCRSGTYDAEQYLYNVNRVEEGIASPDSRKLYLLEDEASMTIVSGCAVIDGHLKVTSDDLALLRGLTEVKGTLTISGGNLANLTGLERLTKVENMVIVDSPNLANLEGLEQLKELGELRIENNSSLVSLQGLEGIQKIDHLVLTNNPQLAQTGRFSKLEQINRVSVTACPKLNQCDLDHLKNRFPELDVSQPAASSAVSSCSIVISSQKDYEQLDGFREFYGSISLRNGVAEPSVPLPIRSIMGRLTVDQTTVETLGFLGELELIGEFHVSKNPQLSSLSLTSLRQAGHLHVEGNDLLESLVVDYQVSSATVASNIALESVAFSTLELAESLTVNGNPQLTSFTAPMLKSTHLLRLQDSSKLTTFTLPMLEQVTTLHLSSNTALQAISFPELTTIVSWTLEQTGMLVDAFDAPKLTNLGTLIVQNNPVTEFSLTKIEQIDRLTLQSNTGLQGVSFPDLQRLSTALTVSGNSTLTALNFPVLAEAVTLDFERNAALQSVILPELTTSSRLTIGQQGAGTTFDAPKLTNLRDLVLGAGAGLQTLSLPSVVTITNAPENFFSQQGLHTLIMTSLTWIGEGQGLDAKIHVIDSDLRILELPQLGSGQNLAMPSLIEIRIEDNADLTSFSLPKTQWVNRITVARNPLLETLSLPLANMHDDIANDHHLVIEENPQLTTIGLTGLSIVHDSVRINDNDSLLNLNGLSGLLSASSLHVKRNQRLNAVTGLGNLQTLGTWGASGLPWVSLEVSDNPSLPCSNIEQLVAQLGNPRVNGSRNDNNLNGCTVN